MTPFLKFATYEAACLAGTAVFLGCLFLLITGGVEWMT